MPRITFNKLIKELDAKLAAKKYAFGENEKTRVTWEGIAVWIALGHTFKALKNQGALMTGSAYPGMWDVSYEPGNLESCDGLIMHQNRSCKNMSLLNDEGGKRIQKNLGVPYVIFDGDQTDPRNFSEAQFDTRVEALCEMMNEKKANEGGNIDELISKFQDVANHPKKTVLEYKKNTGKGLVGIMPYYAPEEIVYAAGYLPVGLFGAQKPQISAARTYLPPFACSLMQADMELQLNGTYDCLDAVIFSVPCDTLRCMSQKWHGKAPVIVFTHPQNRKIDAAVDFLKGEYEHVRSELERILGVTITDMALQEAIKVYNENRRVMREFCDVAAQYPQIFTPVKRHDVIKARWPLVHG